MNKKFLIIILVLIVIWGSTFYFISSYAEELRNHPCSLCAKKIGEDVSCSVLGATKIFLTNGSIEEWEESFVRNLTLFNFTKDG